MIFERGSRVATLNVSPKVDLWHDVGDLEIKAQVLTSANGDYRVGATNTATMTIVDIHGTPSGFTRINVSADQPSVAEGGAATFTFTRSGETTQPLTVDFQVEDTGGFLRGNDWDPPPQIPNQVAFAANSTSESLSITTPDDQRDLSDSRLKVVVLPSADFLLSQVGLETSAEVSVTDNDTAQELELHFGKDGTNDVDINEGEILKFVVKRRQQDAGQTATFTVRVETNRRGADHHLADWETNSSNANRVYKDFPLEITGSDTEVEREILVPVNGVQEANWKYWAEILRLKDHQGDNITRAQEAKYWTVKQGFRETEVEATDSGDENGTVSIATDVTEVQEGDQVTYTLTREGGPVSESLTITVRTREPNRRSGSDNPSRQWTDVTFAPWQTTGELTVQAYVDGAVEPNTDTLQAEITETGSTRYTLGTSKVDVEINDPPSNLPAVTVSASPTSVLDGGSTTVTFTRTGDTTDALAVNMEVRDPAGMLRGNHWDPAPTIPTQVVIPAGSSAGTITLTAPEDQRALPGGTTLVTVSVREGTGYYPGQTGLSTSVTISVTDNDTAQELELKWGYIAADDSNWETGDSYGGECSSYSCTFDGPAEGSYYYDSQKDFRFSREIETFFPAHFQVTRRAADIGKTAPPGRLVDRPGNGQPLQGLSHHADREPADRRRPHRGPGQRPAPRLGPLGKDSPDRGLRDRRGAYRRPGGPVLDDQRPAGKHIGVTDRTSLLITVQNPRPKEVAEGETVEFTIRREGGYVLEPLPIQVRIWEPNRAGLGGVNPTDEIHSFEFPAVPITADFVPSRGTTQRHSITVATLDDSDYEAQDSIRAEVVAVGGDLYKESRLRNEANILDNDRPDITLTADKTALGEGETVTFTLTRAVNTRIETTVGVAVDDPGGFLQGNSISDRVETPSSITFAPGEVTKTLAITPPEDWRDIPDSTLTFTVADEPHYTITADASIAVPVTDNDIAPQWTPDSPSSGSPTTRPTTSTRVRTPSMRPRSTPARRSSGPPPE